jgi:hypothetical protein
VQLTTDKAAPAEINAVRPVAETGPNCY